MITRKINDNNNNKRTCQRHTVFTSILILPELNATHLNRGLSVVTMPTSISDGLKSADSTDERQLMAVCMMYKIKKKTNVMKRAKIINTTASQCKTTAKNKVKRKRHLFNDNNNHRQDILGRRTQQEQKNQENTGKENSMLTTTVARFSRNEQDIIRPITVQSFHSRC